ncbi:hypothetical protein [Spiroplasma endosymbiont of Panzeria rudis]|uniref:hypothetical protein n=1 Tax=Spiroplasma endosymbiont of Panzeria rudis TaxID=3066301 RepID=UPI0030CEE5CC
MDLGLWISFGIIGTVIWILLIRYGIKYCFKNNAMGVFILFVTLNIFGLVLGWAILWNNKNFSNKKEEEKIKELGIFNILNDEQKKKVCGICFKVKDNPETICTNCLKKFEK